MRDATAWVQIQLKEFDELTGGAYPPTTPLNIAREHWKDPQGVLLGVVVLDRIDHDYGYVVLGRDEHDRFRAIEVACSHPSIEKARAALQSMMRKIAESGASMFPQDCLQ